jgi:hypothetical protein
MRTPMRSINRSSDSAPAPGINRCSDTAGGWSRIAVVGAYVEASAVAPDGGVGGWGSGATCIDRVVGNQS